MDGSGEVEAMKGEEEEKGEEEKGEEGRRDFPRRRGSLKASASFIAPLLKASARDNACLSKLKRSAPPSGCWRLSIACNP